MDWFEIVLRLLGITADIVTIVVVIINISIFLKSKKFFADSEYDCSIKFFMNIKIFLSNLKYLKVERNS